MAFERPLRSAWLSTASYMLATVKLLHLELFRIDAVETANIEHHHVFAAGALPVPQVLQNG
jgi:hypothetical protein